MKTSVRPLCLLICCVQLSFVHFALAQGPQVDAVHREKLKKLDYLVGTWKGDFDPPGDVPPGVVTLECKWMCHETYLNIECTFTPNGADVEINPFNLVFGYNGKSKSPYAWQLGLNGQIEMPVHIDQDGVRMAGKGYGIDGQSLSQTVAYEFRSKDELITRTSDRTRDGKKLTQEDPIVFRRVKTK